MDHVPVSNPLILVATVLTEEVERVEPSEVREFKGQSSNLILENKITLSQRQKREQR